MITIENKFEIGDECYTVYNQPVHYKCPICEGVGTFEHNGYPVWCRNCSGSGKLHNSHQFVLAVCKVRIRHITASIGKESCAVKYKVDCIDNTISIKNRSEKTLFTNKDDAEQYCIQVNTQQIAPEF